MNEQKGRPMHHIYHTVYKANEIWFRCLKHYNETVGIVDLSLCIYIETDFRKTKAEKREKNGFDLRSPGSYYGKNTQSITCTNQQSYQQY